MPLIRLYLAPNILSSDEKKEVSIQLTDIYTSRGLPPFYVNIIFIETPPNCLFVGGEPQDKFVRICIEHIALHFPSDDRKRSYMKKLDSIIQPLFQSKGYQWEYHISETPRDLWKVQSIIPPPYQSLEERSWMTERRAIPY